MDIDIIAHVVRMYGYELIQSLNTNEYFVFNPNDNTMITLHTYLTNYHHIHNKYPCIYGTHCTQMNCNNYHPFINPNNNTIYNPYINPNNMINNNIITNPYIGSPNNYPYNPLHYYPYNNLFYYPHMYTPTVTHTGNPTGTTTTFNCT